MLDGSGRGVELGAGSWEPGAAVGGVAGREVAGGGSVVKLGLEEGGHFARGGGSAVALNAEGVLGRVEPEAHREVREVVETRGLSRGPVEDLSEPEGQLQDCLVLEDGAVGDRGVAEVEGGEGGEVDTVREQSCVVLRVGDEGREIAAALEGLWNKPMAVAVMASEDEEEAWQPSEKNNKWSRRKEVSVCLFVCLFDVSFEGTDLHQSRQWSR